MIEKVSGRTRMQSRDVFHRTTGKRYGDVLKKNLPLDKHIRNADGSWRVAVNQLKKQSVNYNPNELDMSFLNMLSTLSSESI